MCVCVYLHLSVPLPASPTPSLSPEPLPSPSQDMRSHPTISSRFHTYRPSALRTPPVPQWKGDDSPPNSPVRTPPPPPLRPFIFPFAPRLLLPLGRSPEPPVSASSQEAEAPQEQGKPNEEWQHDDPLGEPIHEDMANLLRSQVMEMCRGYPPGINDRMMFPGSQPVSLDRTNLSFLLVRRRPSRVENGVKGPTVPEFAAKDPPPIPRVVTGPFRPPSLVLLLLLLLQERRYYVTWKADGTRYMLLLRADGTYLIDRQDQTAMGCDGSSAVVMWVVPAREWSDLEA